MNVGMRTKVLINFGAWKVKCVDLWLKKLLKVYSVHVPADTCKMHTLNHTNVSSTMSPGDETLEYECRHENKGTD